MNKYQLTLKVLEHWEDIIQKAVDGVSLDAINICGSGCAYCCMYGNLIDCHPRCPVKTDTQRALCKQTPWRDVNNSRQAKNRKRFIEAAFVEYMYLLNIAYCQGIIND